MWQEHYNMDDYGWYRARTNRMILDLTQSNKEGLIGWIEVGESVDRKTAEKSVKLYEQEIKKEFKKSPKDESSST